MKGAIMSREILFRAYSKEFGMLTVSELHIDDEWIRSSNNIELSTENIELMQYTGLDDDDGKKIFSGDIIGGNYDGYVEWCDQPCCGGAWSLYFPNHGCLDEIEGDNFMWKDIADRSFGEVKIVGNIFENPEYMKEKNTRFQKHELLEQAK